MPARPGFERKWRFDNWAIAKGASFSGHERNRLFVNLRGESFQELSGISGLDTEADGRSFAIFDFDRDGWQDIALVNANSPFVELFRNRIGEAAGVEAAANRMVALRFFGSNQTDAAKPGSSNRDGIGTRVELRFDGHTIYRERRGGEGFAAQNSATLLIGVGARPEVDGLVVRWPSGRVQEIGAFETGQLLSVYEDPSQSPTGEAFVREPYVTPRAAAALHARSPTPLPRRIFPLHPKVSNGDRPRLRVYTTMATWCAICQGELPHWQRLSELFDPGDLEIRAVPVDLTDTKEMLERYVQQLEPAYKLLSELSAADVASVNELLLQELGKPGLPASFVTDAAGRVLDSSWGAPSVSRLRQLLSKRD